MSALALDSPYFWSSSGAARANSMQTLLSVKVETVCSPKLKACICNTHSANKLSAALSSSQTKALLPGRVSNKALRLQCGRPDALGTLEWPICPALHPRGHHGGPPLTFGRCFKDPSDEARSQTTMCCKSPVILDFSFFFVCCSWGLVHSCTRETITVETISVASRSGFSSIFASEICFFPLFMSVSTEYVWGDSSI